MKNKFKPGDKVIVTEDEHGNCITEGSYGVVEEIISGEYNVVVQYEFIRDIEDRLDSYRHRYSTQHTRLRLYNVSDWKSEVSE